MVPGAVASGFTVMIDPAAVLMAEARLDARALADALVV
jgi:hypothetical protein